MTDSDRRQRQLEDNKAEVGFGAQVDAIYRPTGTRSIYDAVKGRDGELVMRPENTSLPECSLDSLVVQSVLRRGWK